jgi:hypothetical protein
LIILNGDWGLGIGDWGLVNPVNSGNSVNPVNPDRDWKETLTTNY